jgi:CheY-like chemotaxis protein
MRDPLHILVVEDTLIAQIAIQSRLSEAGCTVDVVSDGPSALNQAILTKYDLILMDIGLGDGPNGFEVTNEIRKQSQLNRATPIMAVTSHGEPEYQKKALAVGMEGYFNKPFTPEDAQVVINYMNNKYPSN